MLPILDALLRDARYAVRTLGKSPAFTLTATVTLAVAIAANTAVFSVADAVLFRPLPYPDPERLAMVTTTVRANGEVDETSSHNGVTWEAIRDGATTFDRAVLSRWTTGVNLISGSRASYVHQQRVGTGFFRVLGVAPLIGREFEANEDRPNGPPVTILGHALWRTVFNADPAIVGRSIMLRGEPYTVVGVMPEGFQSGDRADLWTPLRPSTTGEGGGENYAIVARLHATTSWAQADAEMRQIGTNLERDRTATPGVTRAFGLAPLQATMAADLREPLLMLWAAVLIVLLVASVNLAGLLLARASGRTREIATRMALGSGRRDVVRQLVVESLIVGVIGGAAGIALGYLALDGLRALAAHAFELTQPVALNGRAIAVSATLALFASLLFGLAPALHATRLDVQAAMSESGGRTVAGGARAWPRRLVIVAQVALGVVLLVGAGLLIRTYTHLRQLSPGFDPANVATLTVSLEDARYRAAERVNLLVEQTLARVRETPGVDSAAVILGLPYERLLNLGFRYLDGPQAGAPQGRITNATYVTPEFFRALRIPVRAGRPFDLRDTNDSAGVVIVSDTFAREYFAGGEALGHRIAFAGREREIVGVVGDVQARPGWGNNGPLATLPLAYIPLTQASDGMLKIVHGWFAPSFVVRATGTTAAVAATVRSALDSVDPLLPFAEVRSMAAVQADSVAEQRLLMVLLAGLALTTVLLGAIGIHGLIATSVVERSREMGIRIALGASVTQALRTLAMPGIVLAAIGTAIGCGAAILFTRLLRHFVWGVSVSDPLTFAAVTTVLLLVATIASVVPALHIARLDPASTLRRP